MTSKIQITIDKNEEIHNYIGIPIINSGEKDSYLNMFVKDKHIGIVQEAKRLTDEKLEISLFTTDDIFNKGDLFLEYEIDENGNKKPRAFGWKER